MRYLMRVRFQVDAGNDALREPEFGEKMQQLLTDMSAEAAYFTAIDGQRGAYIVVSFDDASRIAAICEPLFLWLNADLEIMPVMELPDLIKAGPSLAAAVQKWG